MRCKELSKETFSPCPFCGSQGEALYYDHTEQALACMGHHDCPLHGVLFGVDQWELRAHQRCGAGGVCGCRQTDQG